MTGMGSDDTDTWRASILRSSLEELLESTRNSVPVGGYWVGDKAAERRVSDDMRSGALAFRAAHQRARHGLEALEKGDLGFAEAALGEGKSLLLEAVARQIPAAGLAVLRSGAKIRGRRRTTDERDVALAKAVAQQEARGLRAKDARRIAIAGDPGLKAAFAHMSNAGVLKALRNGRRLLASGTMS